MIVKTKMLFIKAKNAALLLSKVFKCLLNIVKVITVQNCLKRFAVVTELAVVVHFGGKQKSALLLLYINQYFEPVAYTNLILMIDLIALLVK